LDKKPGNQLGKETHVENLRSSDLSRLFGAALESMEANRQEINDLDGYNGNHGDNMVQNLQTITAALAAHQDDAPSEALRFASHELAERGQGGTSQYYVRGLSQAAERLEGRAELNRGDVLNLVQSLLSSVPSEGHPQQMEAGGNVFDQVVGLAGTQGSPASQGMPESPLSALLGGQQPQGSGAGLEGMLGALLGGQTSQPSGSVPDSPLEGLLGGQQPQDSGAGLEGMLGALLGGQTSQPGGNVPDSPLEGLLGGQQPQGGGAGLEGMLGALLGGQAPQPQESEPASPLSGLLGTLLGGQQPQSGQSSQDRQSNLIIKLLPAALAFFRAKQSGAEMPEALSQALMSFLASGQMNPLQTGAPRPAAGGLIAQSMLQALLSAG
jgi:hypothetical protein